MLSQMSKSGSESGTYNIAHSAATLIVGNVETGGRGAAKKPGATA